jgi:hypothetical protein
MDAMGDAKQAKRPLGKRFTNTSISALIQFASILYRILSRGQPPFSLEFRKPLRVVAGDRKLKTDKI